jgi:flagellar biosynthesis/type III secretory pathway M-ring protein FliF/YscJ
MWKSRTPIGQRTEVTNPLIAIVGAIAAIVLAVAAFSFWPNTETVRTAPTANLPDTQKGASEAPGSPKGTN